MNDSVKQKVEEGSFQLFISFPENSSVMVSKQLLQDIQDKKDSDIHKYLPLDYFVDSIIHHYFYLAAPSTWEDPFETKYLDVLNSSQYYKEDLSELKNMSIFCSCMTFNNLENEEASWKSYGDDKEQIIRVSYDFEKLCDLLSKTRDGNIYIGKLDYKHRKEILYPMPVYNMLNEEKDNGLEVLLVNNFCFKQIAYHYENELRFCKVLKGEEFKQQKEYKIKDLDLLPAIKQITLPPINYNKSKTKELEQIKKYLLLKALCRNVSIHVSNLYNPSKVEMTSELDI